MASILLFNTSFQNRGDALMARAVEERLGPDHRWSVPANLAYISPSDTRRFGIYMSSDLPGETLKQRIFNGGAALASTALGLLPRGLRRKSRFLSAAEIDVAFDLSGYSFGDFWGPAKIERATTSYRRLRDHGVKVILMPRTWGPFATIGDDLLERMFECIDLAFARDMKSMEAISRKLSANQCAKLFFAPDYTHAVQPRHSSRVDGADQRIAWIVPNHCVITSGTMSRDEYARLLGAAREQFVGAGLQPKLLLHETSSDLDFIGDADLMGFGSEAVLVTEDAIDAKTLISRGSAVVASSLHATYNALNNGVPVAVIPWNFKYAEALAHYNCGECLVDMSRPQESLAEKIRLITEPGSVACLQERMRTGKAEQVRLTDAMWQRVSEVTGLELSDPQR